MLDETLKKLADPQVTLTHKLLRSLSGLDRSDLSALQEAWPAIHVTRRQQVARALSETAEDDVETDYSDLLKILLADADAEVRATAVAALWETTEQSLADPLVNLLRSDSSALVRAAAADALGHFGVLAADQSRHSARARRIITALLEAFHGADDPLNTDIVRRNALESAALFSDDEEVVAAIRQAYADANLTLRAGAIGAMGQSFDESWVPIVLKELDNTEPEMRFVAARACGELWLEAAVPRLAAMTSDCDEAVRLMAISALGDIGGLHAKAALTQLLESHDESVRDAAEEALEELRFNENPLDLGGMFDSPAGGKKPHN